MAFYVDSSGIVAHVVTVDKLKIELPVSCDRSERSLQQRKMATTDNLVMAIRFGRIVERSLERSL